MGNNITTDTENSAKLKANALPFLPRNLGDVNEQKKILNMIAHVIPTVAPFVRQADGDIWNKVLAGEMPISSAIAQCAFRVDTILENTTYDEQKLRSFPENDLLGAWIALEYYAYVLKTEYSFNILQCKQQLSNVLLTQPAPQVLPDDCGITQPVIPDSVSETQPVDVQKIPEVQIATDPGNTPKKKTPKKKKEKTVHKHSGAWFKKNGKKLVTLAVVAVVIALLVAFFCSDVQQTKSAIKKIDTVTLDSEAQILQAEERYAALDAAQQEKVDNRSDLFAARVEYDSLVTEAAIDEIGTVTLERKDAIVHAEQLYDELSQDAKNKVDNHKTLTAARKEYDRLDAAVKKAETSINAIGTVTLNSGAKIDEARKNYDALKKDKLEKYLEDESSKLIKAEKQYKELVSKDLYDTGMAHHDGKRYEEAIKCFDSIIKDYADTNSLEEAKEAKANSQITLAEQSYGKRDYYTTLKTLKTVDNKYQQLETYKKLHEKTINAITKARPRSGAAIDGRVNWGYCYFNITAKDKDVCFKFVNTKDASKYKMVFVRAGETAKVNLENGTYSIKYTTGTYWFGKEHLFGDDGAYFGKGTADFTTSRSGNWIYYWSFKLDMTDSSFNSYTISANEF